MEFQEYFSKMKNIYNAFLKFIDDNEKTNENFNNLTMLLNDQKINDNQYELKTFLHILANVANNYHRVFCLLYKTIQILAIFKDSIKKYYSNFDIFNIFKKNKRILLYLIEEKVLIINKLIFTRLSNIINLI